MTHGSFSFSIDIVLLDGLFSSKAFIRVHNGQHILELRHGFLCLWHRIGWRARDRSIVSLL